MVKCIGESETQVKRLITEDLEQIKSYNLDDDKKLKVMPKDEVKEHIGRSPDYGDCMVMRMFFEVSGQNYEPTTAQTFYPGGSGNPRAGSPGAPTPVGAPQRANVRYQNLRK